MNISPVKHISGWLPLAMSALALALVLVHLAISGAAREADEGTAAHLWQLLIAVQIPVVAFFALKWLRRSPREALPVLAMQVAAAVAAIVPVYILGL